MANGTSSEPVVSELRERLTTGTKGAAAAEAAEAAEEAAADAAADDDPDFVWADIRSPKADVAMHVCYLLMVYWLAVHVFLPRQGEDGAALLATVVGLTLVAAVAIEALMVASEAGGRWLSDGPLRAAPFSRPLRSRKSMHKFKAQIWQLVVHAGFAVLEWRVLREEPWFEEGWKAAVPSPHVQTNSPELRQLYLAQFAVWLYMGACQLFFLEKQRDYYVMMSHHIITLALVGLSFHHNYVRYGAMVLFIHDASDVFLDLMKTANYLKLEDKAGCYIVELFYASCFVSWPYFRLYLLPKMIWNGTSIWVFWFRPDREEFACLEEDPVAYPGLHEACTSIVEVIGRSTVFWSAAVANVLLCLLVLMHVWWNALLIKGGYDVLFAAPAVEGESKFHKGFAKHYEGGDEDADEAARGEATKSK